MADSYDDTTHHQEQDEMITSSLKKRQKESSLVPSPMKGWEPVQSVMPDHENLLRRAQEMRERAIEQLRQEELEDEKRSHPW